MATFTGVLSSIGAVKSLYGRTAPITYARDLYGKVPTETYSVGTVSRPGITLSPETHAAVAVATALYDDWPYALSVPYVTTVFYAAAGVSARLKEQYRGIAGKPKFTCSDLVPGLDYIITIQTTEGVIGGTYSAYTPVEHIFTAVSETQDVEVYMPIPLNGRQINIASYTNARYYG